jgi:uncharacterized protein
MAQMKHDLPIPDLRAWARTRLPQACFWTVSGAHLYGFQSVDSDVDLRGCFRSEIRALIGLKPPTETLEPKDFVSGMEVEAVSHEVGKYLRLLTKNNGYVLEQIFSPLVIDGDDFLARLRPLAQKFVTKRCYYHYRGFIQTQRQLLDKEEPKKTKSLLYAYRVLLTGIHLLCTGEVQAHLPTLNESFAIASIPELIEQKRGAEFGRLPDLDVTSHLTELDRLEKQMEEAYNSSQLPESGPVDELHEFLVEERLRNFATA